MPGEVPHVVLKITHLLGEDCLWQGLMAGLFQTGNKAGHIVDILIGERWFYKQGKQASTKHSDKESSQL